MEHPPQWNAPSGWSILCNGMLQLAWRIGATLAIVRAQARDRSAGCAGNVLDRTCTCCKTRRMRTHYGSSRRALAAFSAAIVGLACGGADGGGGNSVGTGAAGATATQTSQTNTGGAGTANTGGGTNPSLGGSPGGTSSVATAAVAGSSTDIGGTSGSEPTGGSSGSLAVGGSSSTGGQPASQTGGAQSGGGTSGSNTRTGGASPTGGTSTAGTSVTGGKSASGGSQAQGGTNAASAGSQSQGGTKSAGGSGQTGGATSSGTVGAAGGITSGGAAASGGTTSTRPPTYGGAGATSLYQKYAGYFPIGAAVDSQSYNTHSALLTKHFNSITLENDMKFESLQPNEGQFNYGPADNAVAFATRNSMKVRGHALVWHRQTPAWVFSNPSRDAVLTKMKNHINAVMNHYKGKVYAWDVVNEAIMDDGSYRTGDEEKDDQKSQWYATIGKDYVAEAFKYASAADPTAKLFYNDYYNYVPARRQAIYELLKGLIESGIKVDGVGLQAHLSIEASTVTTSHGYHQHVSELEAAIELYASLGIEVQVTELDISLYVPGVTYTSDTYYTTATFTEQLQAKQAERYRAFFDLFRKYQGTITGVTFWGIADDNTWLSEFSSGRKDFPLLFDTNHQPKKAYYAVVDF